MFISEVKKLPAHQPAHVKCGSMFGYKVISACADENNVLTTLRQWRMHIKDKMHWKTTVMSMKMLFPDTRILLAYTEHTCPQHTHTLMKSNHFCFICYLRLCYMYVFVYAKSLMS